MRTTKAKFLLRPVINRHGAARECALKELRRTQIILSGFADQFWETPVTVAMIVPCTRMRSKEGVTASRQKARLQLNRSCTYKPHEAIFIGNMFVSKFSIWTSKFDLEFIHTIFNIFQDVFHESIHNSSLQK